MRSRPGASTFETLRKLSEELGLVAAGDETFARHLDALLDALDRDLRRALRVAKAKSARTHALDETLAELVHRLEAEWEETPPRGGRPRAEIREETRRRARAVLARNPNAGWPAIRDATGLSEWLAKRVLREERGRKPGQVAGGNPSARPRSS